MHRAAPDAQRREPLGRLGGRGPPQHSPLARTESLSPSRPPGLIYAINPATIVLLVPVVGAMLTRELASLAVAGAAERWCGVLLMLDASAAGGGRHAQRE